MRRPDFNPVLALCLVLGLWAASGLPLLRVAPNRLLSGEPVYLPGLLQGHGLSAGVLLLTLTLAIFFPTRRLTHWIVLGLVSGLMAATVWLAGDYASSIAQTGSTLARTALGAGFWSLMALAWLIGLDAANHLKIAVLPRSVLLMLVAFPLVCMMALGYGSELSIMKEYANRQDVFAQAVLRHLQIVAVAIVPSVLLGLPLAWASYRHPRLRQGMFPILNIIQTIPSIALFGLFMAPLASLAAAYPALSKAGISGVGLAPAALALVLYCLLPIVRSALAGLEQVPVAVKTAAFAMGMSHAQVFWQVEVPLALPVLLPGLRTAVVQTIGLAAVTALVGAGGLGSLMFDGLFSAANELVLLGVLPIVLMAVLADALFKSLSALLKGPVL